MTALTAIATLRVELAHDWLDYLAAFAALFAALGTVAAVVWAIYGPSIRERRRRPSLSLENRYEGDEQIFEADEPTVGDGACLRLANATGRDTAREVEVFLSVYIVLERPEEGPAMVDVDGEPLEIPLVSDENLNFDGNDGRDGRAHVSVPSGVSRRLYLARLGDPKALFASWTGEGVAPENVGEMCGAWATVPATRDMIAWLRDGSKYRIELTIAGANVDPVRYRARVRAARADLSAMELMNMRHPIDVSLEWLEELTRVS
jgi:hypothetical protein